MFAHSIKFYGSPIMSIMNKTIVVPESAFYSIIGEIHLKQLIPNIDKVMNALA